MIQFTHDFSAPIDDVWAVFCDPDLWTEWNTEWAEIRDVRGPFDHVGAGYTQVMRLFGRELLGRWEVVECEPKSWRRVEGVLPLGIPFSGCDRFEEIATGTRVTVEISFPLRLPLLGRMIELMARPMLRRQLASNAVKVEAILTGRHPMK